MCIPVASAVSFHRQLCRDQRVYILVHYLKAEKEEKKNDEIFSLSQYGFLFSIVKADNCLLHSCEELWFVAIILEDSWKVENQGVRKGC